MNILRTRVSPELVLLNLLESRYPGAVGGSLLGDPPAGYVRIAKVPGGRSDRLEGTTVVDIEVFDPSYLAAESRALDIEAFLLGYPHIVEVDSKRVVIDEVEQNAGPAEVFWDDPSVSRILSTYVVTVRR